MPVNVYSGAPLTLMPATHRFFDDLVTAQAGISAYTIGHVVQAGGSWPPFQPGAITSQVCFAVPVEVEYQPAQVLGPISKHAWPATIDLGFHSGSSSATRFPNPTGVQRLMGSLYQQAFISYFENNRDQIEAKFGAIRNWPVTLNFGRVVRNAFGHGGVIDIRDATAVKWRSVSYSKTDNGRVVLYNDLSSGDLTILMLDMDELF